jgi:hypothetical protein
VTKSKWLVRAALVSFAAVLTSTAASAHLVTRTDPNDTEGPMDILQSSFQHENGKFILSFKTAGNWGRNDVVLQNGDVQCFINEDFWLDTKNDSDADYRVVWQWDSVDERMEATLYAWPSGNRIRRVPFTKTEKILTVKVPRDDISVNKNRVGWRAYAARLETCPDNDPAFDYAPDQTGFYHHTFG